MKVEAKLFEFLTAFFFLAGILYTVATAIWGNAEYNAAIAATTSATATSATTATSRSGTCCSVVAPT